MKYSSHIFSTKEKEDAGISALLHQAKSFNTKAHIIRFVWMTSADDNSAYKKAFHLLKEHMRSIKQSIWTLVAQRPLFDEEYSLEVQYAELDENETLIEKECDGDRYLVLLSNTSKQLFLDLNSRDTSIQIREQAEDVFRRCYNILLKEELSVDDIYRQWNYIEQITKLNCNAEQHYQMLNDARSRFYSKAEWKGGYPAATGIGCTAGGIVISINAGRGIETIAIDNPLQIAAHAYSNDQLKNGGEEKNTTPKFERARSVFFSNETMFISGTAAIRGEKSSLSKDAAIQCRMTIENIEELIKQSKTKSTTFSSHPVRVYIKNESNAELIRDICQNMFGNNASFAFIEADICREELLLEIEAQVY
ncbi:MAG: hypothetical protein KBS95_03090 [Alistipes sp.]|nr:hypothetical protein [Candidatus Alistipes equi]